MRLAVKWFVGIMLFTGTSLGHAQSVNGTLLVVKGDVQIKSGQTGQTTRARIGGQVFPKDVVITGKDARAKIVMADKNEINISPESQIEIQHYEFDPSHGKKDVLLNVLYGKVRAKVEQHYDGKTSKFQVKTPAAVAGVRGTDFMTSFDRASGNSQVVTFRGAVEFGLPGPGGTIQNAVSVTPGKVASSVAGAAPKAPLSMPKEQLAKVENDSKADSAPAAGSKNGPAPASTKSGGAANGSGNGTTAATDASSSRAPASDSSAGPNTGGSASTIKPEDLPASSAPIPPPVASSVPSTIISAPPALNPVAPCTTCNQVLQNATGGNAKINVIVK